MEWRQPRWDCWLELYFQSASAASVSEASIAVIGSKRVPEGPRVGVSVACLPYVVKLPCGGLARWTGLRTEAKSVLPLIPQVLWDGLRNHQ